ncbi:FkbM family methyltransferase [Pseudanabaena sp. PCC 6802]|uniref:FkbM family methyltransferase n=1 Tax=Pseudanabaena sp. PCC 6802 TaxID=118173 RepID=UPI000348FB9F|nr:FkbM family methyltransferase [Pseudanabaena sp. PCC 6802]
MQVSYSSHGDRYCDYLLNNYPDIDAGVLQHVEAIVESTNWDNPASSLDWNNLAILELIEAEQSENLEIKAQHVQVAIQSLEKGFQIDRNPLCAAHYALIQIMTNSGGNAINLSYATLLNAIQTAYTSSAQIEPGLIYLPPSKFGSHTCELLLKSQNYYTQSLISLSEALWRSQLVFYSQMGVRFLQLANQITPNSTDIQLRLGIGHLMAGQFVEGVLSLQNAGRMAPECIMTLHALYLGYRTIGNLEASSYWLERARNLPSFPDNALNPMWQWTRQPVDSEITYVGFEQNLVMAVEPSFNSIVTSVLVSEGDWFEYEMEFWRKWIQPGMTIIDVGANAGVYTFSAARAVGSTGRVFAIEPFSKCVRYLNETRSINRLDWVKICPGAASDRNGTAKLSLSPASELNKLVSGEAESNVLGNFEEVECFTLDSLIARENVQRVDLLKIDAEGHEIKVLQGSDRLLKEFSPIILYENIVDATSSNLPAAKFLTNIGYKLFKYQPYLQKLIPLNAEADLLGMLNVVAMPSQIV